ncbi:RING finger protein 17 isoform X3 [Ooceraea biroi]|uniref:RING finger protein 17 isoform X3 n=1 Tax=Ooceraea biroi TaxID=2015173 RepID=UPI000F091EED|nr:RING finger protein 17 isoform X3 [Ooceraea biroi]
MFLLEKRYVELVYLLGLKGLLAKKAQLPLLLNCGHSICSKCVKSRSFTNCDLCKKRIVITTRDKQEHVLPLNLYALGLIVSSYHRPLTNEDEDFVFYHRMSTRLRQISKKGSCHECGKQANVKCLQCTALYCFLCYSKIHGRALQNHTHISITEGSADSPAGILNSCSPKCSEPLSYYCSDCNVAACSNCTLHLHKLHNFVTLAEKNEALLSEFDQVYENLEETLLRVGEAREKVKSALTSNTYKLQNIEDVETSITRHFAHLHGVLQNMEAKLLNELHHQSNDLKANLEDIEVQLRSQEETLKMTMQMACYTKQIFYRVDMQNAIQILKESVDLPCYLMYKDTCHNGKATFTVDDSIITAIENHCTIQTPLMSSYHLARKDELPKNYILTPLMRTHHVHTLPEPPALQLASLPPLQLLPEKPSTSDSISITSAKSEDKQIEDTSDCNVEITYINNASAFFVRKITDKPKFDQLEVDLLQHEKNRQVTQSVEIKQDDMCVVRQQIENKWYRGHVKAVNIAAKDDGRRTYNVFYVDHGHVENHVPASRVRDIAKHFQEIPPQVMRCSLHGLKPKNGQWTLASTNDFIKLTSEADCSISMTIFKTTSIVYYVDLCVVTMKNNNMGPQSLCSAMVNMNHARLKTLSSTMQTAEHRIHDAQSIVYDREELPLKKCTRVLVQYIDSPDKVYVMKWGANRDKLTRIIKNLDKYYEESNSPNTIDAPQPGMACAVQVNSFWQRAEIVEVINEEKVTVFCVDSGFSFATKCTALRAIPQRYVMLKAQAIRISLMYIMAEPDGTWKSEASTKLFNMFCDSEYITVTPRKKLRDGYCGCMHANNIDVSRQLKAAGVVNEFFYNASKKMPQKSQSPVRSSSSCSSNSEKSEECSAKESFDNAEKDKSTEKTETTKDPFKVEVLIQRVVTPYCIYVAQKEHEESNATFMLEMQKFYNTYHCPTKDDWREGGLCAVYSAKDKAYFRAKISKIGSPTEVSVFFYDVGIEETVTVKDLQILHEKFAKQPAHYFKVKLAGILPCGGSSTWLSLSCTTLFDIIQENRNCKFYITKLIQEEAYDGAVPVELWIRQTRIPGPLLPATIEINSINRMLVDKGVALPIKNYFSKAVSVLATELKRQLANNCEFLPSGEEQGEVKWLKKALLGVDCKELSDTAMSHRSDSSSCNNDIDFDNVKSTKHQDSTLTDKSSPIKFSNWLPAVEITEEVFYAIPTNVDNNCAIYLHPKKYNADMLHYIQTELQTHCKSIKVNVQKEWKKGDVCLARYHHDKKWYRGRISENTGTTLQVEFIDYGNVEECEMKYVTGDIKLGDIPIQCTKCIISGLKPENPTGKWMMHDLDRIHALLVDKECKVTVLQREPTHIIISLMLLRPWKCDLLLYLTNHMDMSIKIERKEWNEDLANFDNDFKSCSTKSGSTDVIIEEIIDNEKAEDATDTLETSLLDLRIQNATLNETVISGNVAELTTFEFNSDKKICDFDNESCSDAISLDKMLEERLISSTPQRQLDEDNFFGAYKRVTIPPETKCIEIILCCNKDPVTCYAQLATNDDDVFHHMFFEYHLQYEMIMEELQLCASSQPLIQSFEKNTPCVAKFSDDTWYRCIITHSEKVSNTQCIQISLHYVDYGNYEYRMLDSLSDHGLHVPKKEWLELPAMAIKCTFWGLKFVNTNVDLLATKLSKIYNQAVVARIKEINESDIVAEIYKDKTFKELLYVNLIQEGVYQQLKQKSKKD